MTATSTAGDTASSPAPRRGARGSRRTQILGVAVDLFATKGYHGVSMDDIGVAAGVTGPALYHHFAGKEAMLAEAIVPVSEHLLAGARRLREERGPDGTDAVLRELIAFHVAFALDNPAVIALQSHELARLPEEGQRTIRRVQRSYVEEWVDVLLEGGWYPARPAARVAAHAAFGLMNSTPFVGRELPRHRLAGLLRDMARSALCGPAASGTSSG